MNVVERLRNKLYVITVTNSHFLTSLSLSLFVSVCVLREKNKTGCHVTEKLPRANLWETLVTALPPCWHWRLLNCFFTGNSDQSDASIQQRWCITDYRSIPKSIYNTVYLTVYLTVLERDASYNPDAHCARARPEMNILLECLRTKPVTFLMSSAFLF